jgi:cytochrome c oxidase subunit 2
VTLTDGRELRADDQYLRDAILDPNAHIVAGYRAIMPTYRGVIDEADAIKLVAYLRDQASVPGGRGG